MRWNARTTKKTREGLIDFECFQGMGKSFAFECITHTPEQDIFVSNLLFGFLITMNEYFVMFPEEALELVRYMDLQTLWNLG